jgi:hypothetical protein
MFGHSNVLFNITFFLTACPTGMIYIRNYKCQKNLRINTRATLDSFFVLKSVYENYQLENFFYPARLKPFERGFGVSLYPKRTGRAT